MRTNCLFLLLLLIGFTNIHAQNRAAYFSAFSKYYRCGDITVTGDQLTVEALVKLDGTGPYFTGQSANDIVSKHHGAGDANYILRPDHCEISTDKGHFVSKINLPAFSYDSFYHVAMTYNGSSLKFYVNGCLFSDVPASGNLITNDYITTIGQLASNPTALGIEQLYGYTDEVRIWSVARTGEQIRDNMHKLDNPTTQTGLLAYYKFEGNSINVQGNANFDAVPFGNPVIIVQDGFTAVKTLAATYTIQQPSCNMANGRISIHASGGKAPYSYSLDGINFGSNNVFEGLKANVPYKVFVRGDGSGCMKDTLINLSEACSQNACDNWLVLPSQPAYVRVGDLDIPGNKVTVEALLNRTAPWNGVDLFQGDIVSKHEDYKDINYLLRPSSAEITTSNGYFKTPVICPIELNKTYHVAMVYDGATLKFYRNGFLMSQIAASGNLVLNNWQTQIGLYFNQVTQENFIGYINEVRIWNIARTQPEIRNFMSQSLPAPQTINGLLAYYTFDNLLNKQGNPAWNGQLGGSAGINKTNPACELKIDSCNIKPCSEVLLPDFDFTQDVCNPKKIIFSSSMENMLVYDWNFGNGQTGTGGGRQEIIYQDYGLYTITLKVKNNQGCEATISKNVTVDMQPADIIITADTTICKGDSFILRTDPANVDFCWQSSNGLFNSNSNNPSVTPLVTTTYTFTSKSVKQNLVVNGNFSSGNNDFQSGYAFSSTGIPEGVYNVNNNVQAWHSGLAACADNTGSNGNMLMINGSGVKDVKVWYQTIAVVPNTNYVFSAWVQSLSPSNPAHLQFSINGNTIGADLHPSNQICQWTRFYNTWNSGANTTATIAIVNVNQQLMGNDFALDDLFFGEVVMKQEMVTVNVVEKPLLTVTGDTTVCEGTNLQLRAAGAQLYKWTPANTLSADNIANPIASPVKTTSYIVAATAGNGCVVKDSVKVIVQPKPQFKIVGESAVCKGDTLTLKAAGGDSYKWLPNNSLISSAGDALVFPQTAATYQVQVKNDLCNITDTLSTTIRVNDVPVSSIYKSNDIDCSNTTANLNASGGQAYKWWPATGLSNAAVPNPVASPRETITYHVIVSNGAGCSVNDSITVQVTNTGNSAYYVPTAFTPDGNGKNDSFGVKYWGQVDEFSMLIYNRWGEVVFQTNNVATCWDGKYKGVQQPGGVFIYLIKAKTFCGNIEKKGTVTLVR